MLRLLRAPGITLLLLAQISIMPLARADDTLAAISQRMKKAELVRGQFAQEKYFSIMTRPLKSTGTFTLDRQKGIWWHNTTPIPGDLVISDAGILQRSSTGSIQHIDSTRQPALKMMTDIIRQLVSGDWAQLGTHFVISASLAPQGPASGSLTPEEWSATLTPKPGSLFANYAERVDLKGQEYVQSIDITEKSGDKTAIRFSALGSDGPLQASEVDAFAW